MNPWVARAGALPAGALPAVAFLDATLSPVAWVCLVPVLLILRGSRSGGDAAWRGWFFGAGFVAAAQYWVAPNLVYFFPIAVAVLALLWSCWGVLAWILLRGRVTAVRSVVAAVGVPAGWVLVEAVRSWQWLGGSWGQLGASQWQHPTALASAAVGGVWLVSFLVVAANTAVTLVVTGTPSARAVGGVGAGVALAAGPVCFAVGPSPTTTGTLRVALVQSSIADPGNLDRQVAESRAVGRGSDLVVWGESSVGTDLRDSPDVLDALTSLSGELDADLLVNVDARVAGTDSISKTSTLVDETGVVAEYRKTRLVPFGEYVPFRDRLGWIGRVTAAADRNRVPGHDLVVMDVKGTAVGPLISFELTFPDLARSQVANGAEVLAYQTSTATFQGSAGPSQLASAGAVRAAETGRPVVVTALTGVSAAFDARGRTLAWLPGDDGALVVDVEPASGRTPYTALGDWVPVTCAATVLALAGIAITRRVARPRRAQARSAYPG